MAAIIKARSTSSPMGGVLTSAATIRVMPRRDASDLRLIADMVESNRLGDAANREQTAQRLRKIADTMLVRGKAGAYTPGLMK